MMFVSIHYNNWAHIGGNFDHKRLMIAMETLPYMQALVSNIYGSMTMTRRCIYMRMFILYGSMTMTRRCICMKMVNIYGSMTMTRRCSCMRTVHGPDDDVRSTKRARAIEPEPCINTRGMKGMETRRKNA